MTKSHGRGTSGKRGIGTGKSSFKTSTASPAKAPSGFKKTGGDGMGGKVKGGKGGNAKY
jgi:hypothetical protein